MKVIMYNLEECSHLRALSAVERETEMTDDLGNESEEQLCWFLGRCSFKHS